MATERRTMIGPEGYSELTVLPDLDDLRGMKVRDVDGSKAGTVDDVYVDAERGYARYLSIKTGWFGAKRHMVPIDDVHIVEADGERYLTLPYDEERLRGAPTHDVDEDFTSEHEKAVYGHYGRPGYWDREEIVRERQTAPAPTPEIAEAEVDDAVRRGRDPRQVRVKRWGV